MKLYITTTEHERMLAYAEACAPNEIGGLCSIDKVDGENAFMVHRVYITKQKVFPAHFELDDEAQVKLDEECMDEKRAGELSMMWHSHVNMPTNPSKNDDDTLIAKSKEGPTISMIVNLKGDIHCRYRAVLEDEWGVKLSVETKMEVIVENDIIDMDEIRKEVKAKTILPPKPKPKQGAGGQRYNQVTQKWEPVGGQSKQLSLAGSNPSSGNVKIPRALYYIRQEFDSLSDAIQEDIKEEARMFGCHTDNSILKYYEENYSTEVGGM